MPRAWRNRLVAAGSGLTVACMIVCVAPADPPASADPRDWVPWCTGDQTPADSNCRVNPNDGRTDNAPGANPDVPLGVTPDLVAVAGQSS